VNIRSRRRNPNLHPPTAQSVKYLPNAYDENSLSMFESAFTVNREREKSLHDEIKDNFTGRESTDENPKYRGNFNMGLAQKVLKSQ
jgi:hypothetical protein